MHPDQESEGAVEELVAGARHERTRRATPTGTAPGMLLAAALALAASIVVTHRPVTLAGHGSRALPPAHVQYQPYLGRPVF